MNILIPLFKIYNYKYFDYLMDIIEKNKNANIIILDFNDNEISHKVGLSKFTNHIELLRARKYFINEIKDTVTLLKPFDISPDPDLVKKINNLSKMYDIDSLFEPSLSRSISLDIATNLSGSVEVSKKLLRTSVLTSYQNYELSFKNVSTVLQTRQVDVVIILNGQYPIQLGAKTAAKNKSQILFLEHTTGFTDRYHLKDYMIQDRKNVINDFVKNQDNLEPSELFTVNSIFVKSGAKAIEKFEMSIFSSSEDEFIGLEEFGYPKINFYEQEQKLKEVINKNLDKKIAFKMHPNLINKSFFEIRRMYRAYEKYPISIFSPTSKISSYELIKNSQKVVVYNSTIGLEAVAMGTQTYSQSVSLYSDLLKLVSMNVPERTNSHPKSDKYLALKFISYLNNYGNEICQNPREDIKSIATQEILSSKNKKRKFIFSRSSQVAKFFQHPHYHYLTLNRFFSFKTTEFIFYKISIRVLGLFKL